MAATALHDECLSAAVDRLGGERILPISDGDVHSLIGNCFADIRAPGVRILAKKVEPAERRGRSIDPVDGIALSGKQGEDTLIARQMQGTDGDEGVAFRKP